MHDGKSILAAFKRLQPIHEVVRLLSPIFLPFGSADLGIMWSMVAVSGLNLSPQYLHRYLSRSHTFFLTRPRILKSYPAPPGLQLGYPLWEESK